MTRVIVDAGFYETGLASLQLFPALSRPGKPCVTFERHKDGRRNPARKPPKH